MNSDNLTAMIQASNASWWPMKIWEDREGEPPIGHKALSMAIVLLHEVEPRFVHLRATTETLDFKLTIFTDDHVVSIEYDGVSNYPVGTTIPRRSINRLDLVSVNVTTITQYGSGRQPLTYLVGYPEFSLTLTTNNVLVHERREAISALFPTLLDDWENKRFEPRGSMMR
jgi:hypothetical protein